MAQNSARVDFTAEHAEIGSRARTLGALGDLCGDLVFYPPEEAEKTNRKAAPSGNHFRDVLLMAHFQ